MKKVYKPDINFGLVVLTDSVQQDLNNQMNQNLTVLHLVCYLIYDKNHCATKKKPFEHVFSFFTTNSLMIWLLDDFLVYYNYFVGVNLALYLFALFIPSIHHMEAVLVKGKGQSTENNRNNAKQPTLGHSLEISANPLKKLRGSLMINLSAGHRLKCMLTFYKFISTAKVSENSICEISC